jgi:regulatory protein
LESKITKVEIQKNNKNRVNIYIDEEFAFACDAQLVYIHNIAKGVIIEKKGLQDIINEDNYIKGKSCALHFLERSAKSAKQIIDKLTIKEFDNKTIDRVMEFLKQYEFIDDSRYVELFIKEKIKTCGKNKIKFALIKKSLPQDLIKEAINRITSEQQLETALILGEKRMITLLKSENDRKKLYKKVSDYLMRTGYDYQIVNEVLNKITETDNTGEDRDNELSKNGDTLEDTVEEDYIKLKELASKRYSILIKSEPQKIKLYKKLGDYLLRRGYKWDEIKKVLGDLINGVEDL